MIAAPDGTLHQVTVGAYYVDELDCWFLSRFEDIWEQTGETKTYSAAARGTTPAHLLCRLPTGVRSRLHPPRRAAKLPRQCSTSALQLWVYCQQAAHAASCLCK